MPAPVPMRQFGHTDMMITRLGFGAWAIGGEWRYGWGSSEDDVAIAAIRFSVESGVNWIDTAAVYGLGHSEEVVGRAVADFPEADRPFIFTKCGLQFDEAKPFDDARRVGAPASIRKDAEDSLRRLGVERIDLYQMHWPPADGTPVEEYWQTMLDLKAEGKVRAVGLSNHDVALLERAEALGHVDSLQPPFSAIRRDAAADVLPWCAANETGAIVYSPMQSGLLTGAFSPERVAALEATDWRRNSPEFTTNLDANLQVASAMREVAEGRGMTTSTVAIAWTLAFPGVTGAIVGARTPEQVDDWIAAGEVRLSDEDFGRIGAAISASGAGSGPTHP